MKNFCAIICEFNPFHNGHKYLIERAKAETGCDKVLCIMSGSFTQRGDIAVLDKYARARHAVQNGADCVIELPVAFSVAPAEIFADGAIKILSSIPAVSALCFGSESGGAEDFYSAARILLDESGRFKACLNENLASGESYIRSYSNAFQTAGGDDSLLSAPNNILATEYAKAVLSHRSKIEIYPVKRKGAGYGDDGMKDNFSSAAAIRKNLASPLIATNVPDEVFNDLSTAKTVDQAFDVSLRLALIKSSAEDLNGIFGCTEGLENKLKNLENLPVAQILENTASRRYTRSRIKRILTANLLGLYCSDCFDYLSSELFVKPLAIKKEFSDEILAELGKSSFPLVTRGKDKLKLTAAAKKCFDTDFNAYKIWNLVNSVSEFKEKILFI